MARASDRVCRGCGGLMQLLSNARSRILLFWCPACHRIAEQYQPETPPRPATVSFEGGVERR
jgi:hypothetical protein